MISQALHNLRPTSVWGINGNTYDGIEWYDTENPQPSREEIEEEILRIRAEWKATEYQRLRQKEYPPVTDYLDAVVKGDQEQMQAYIDACLAVKAKYPKGV